MQKMRKNQPSKGQKILGATQPWCLVGRASQPRSARPPAFGGGGLGVSRTSGVAGDHGGPWGTMGDERGCWRRWGTLEPVGGTRRPLGRSWVPTMTKLLRVAALTERLRVLMVSMHRSCPTSGNGPPLRCHPFQSRHRSRALARDTHTHTLVYSCVYS